METTRLNMSDDSQPASHLHTRQCLHNRIVDAVLPTKLLSVAGTLSCDHTKVTPYFIESINSKAGFWAVPCPNQFLYYLGFCNPPDDQYVLMGEHVSHK